MKPRLGVRWMKGCEPEIEDEQCTRKRKRKKEDELRGEASEEGN